MDRGGLLKQAKRSPHKRAAATKTYEMTCGRSHQYMNINNIRWGDFQLHVNIEQYMSSHLSDPNETNEILRAVYK